MSQPKRRKLEDGQGERLAIDVDAVSCPDEDAFSKFGTKMFCFGRVDELAICQRALKDPEVRRRFHARFWREVREANFLRR